VTVHLVGVLDTNAVVLLDRLNPDDLPVQPTITSITLAELSVGPLVTDEPAERATRQARLQEAENAFDLPLFTCNARDFAVIDALTVVSVPPPDGVSS
jgi:tRNA(fMet)-specific endonuclease VapC